MYIALAAGVGGAGCEKEPSPLEQQVQASEVGLKVAPGAELHGRRVSGEQELDLSTPEAFLRHYTNVYNSVMQGDRPIDDLIALHRGISDKDRRRTIKEYEQLLHKIKVEKTVIQSVEEGEYTVITYTADGWQIIDGERKQFLGIQNKLKLVKDGSRLLVGKN